MLPRRQGVARSDDDDQPILPVGSRLQPGRAALGSNDANLHLPGCDGADDCRTGLLLKTDTHLWVFTQEITKVFRQETVDCVGVGEQRHLTGEAAGIGGQIGVHLFELGENLAGVTQQRLAGGRRRQAAGMAGEERHAERRFELRQAVAGRRGRQMHRLGGTRQTAAVGNGGDEAQVRQVIAQGFVSIECLL